MPTLKELRRYRFMSQVDLAKKAGVDSITISRLERGIQKPSLQTVRKLTDALEVEVADIEFQRWPEEEDYWKDLQLPPKLKERIEDEAEGQRPEAEVNVITIEGELADRLRSPPHSREEAEPNLEVEKEQDTSRNLRENEGHEESSSSVLPLERKVANEVAPEKTALAVTTIAPIGLAGTNKWWAWLLLIAGICIAAYFIYRLYSRRTQQQKEATKPHKPRTVDEFLDNY